MSPNIREWALGAVKVADKAVGPLVGAFPDSLKYGSAFVAKRALLATYEADPFAALRAQEDGISKALQNARSTPFWAELVPTRSTDPAADLRSLPILTREDLSLRYKDMTGAKTKSLELMSSSGSGGNPVNFLLPRDRRAVEWAYVTHAWREARYSTSDWRVVFRGFPPQNTLGVEPNFSLREIRVTAMRTSEETYEAIAKEMLLKNIRFLHGYPSAIALFAVWLADNKPDLAAAVGGVFPVSEKLDPERFSIIKSSFPSARVISFYGLSEKSAFAVCEDPMSGIYSFAPSYGYVEVVDHSGRAVKPGQTGRVISTRLEYQSASLLRYDTGDLATLVSEQDDNTGQCLRVSNISPRRSVSYVLSRNGEEVATSPGLQAGSKLFQGNIAEYQIIQKAPGHVNFIYRALQPLSSSFNDLLEFEIQEKLGLSFEVSAREVTEIPAGRNGKKPLVIRDFNDS